MDTSGSPALPRASDADRVVIPLPSLGRERALRFSVLVDAVTAVTLGIAGWHSFTEGHPALGCASIAAAVFMVVAAVRELRGTHGHGGFHAWADVAALTMTLVEAWHKHAEGRNPRTSVVLAIVLLARLVFTTRLRGLRRAEIDAHGIFVRSSPFRSFRLAWSDVARVEIDAASATFTRVDGGTHSLALRRLRDGTRIGERLSEAVARLRPDAAAPALAP